MPEYWAKMISCPECGKDMEEGGIVVDGDCEKLGLVCIDEDCPTFLGSSQIMEYYDYDDFYEK
tara:strand:- start:465 stop:653 length:189 start_codon:yes stop_codon:yes gene_type:complete